MAKAYERLFFALWPDERVRMQIDSIYKTFTDINKKGRRVPLFNLHLTLHFLGNVSLDKIDCYVERANEVKASQFDLAINERGYFKKPKIVWMGLEHSPDALIDLQRQLGQCISSCGFGVDRRPYNPHITVARKIYQDPGKQMFESISWRVDRFVLIISEPFEGGVRYRVKASYPLQP